MSISLPIKYDIKVECPECSETINDEIKIEHLEFASCDEREMGVESQYDFTVEVQCQHCKACFEVNGEVWEYPEGAVNLVQIV